MEDESNDHEEQCMARHPGFGCTCDELRRVFHTSRDISAGQVVHEGRFDDCPRCSPPGSTEQPNAAEKVEAFAASIVHRDELLNRAAAMIDPDGAAQLGGVTHEMRLDWLAKWREVVGR